MATPEPSTEPKPERPLRIAICLSHFHPTVGGAERQLFQLAACWARWGHRPLVLSRRLPGLARREVIEGIEIRRVISTVSLGPLFGLSYLGFLSANLLRFARRFDVVLAGQISWEAVAVGLVAPVVGKPSLARIASVGPRGDVALLAGAKGSRLWRRLVLRNRLFLVPSEQARAELEQYGCARARIRPFTNGVVIERFRPPYGDEAERQRSVLFVGRLSPEKNPRAVLRAWKLVNRQGKYRLLVAGGGPLAETLAAFSRQESLQNVEFLGQCDDMPAVYRRAAICVQPSPNEGCSNALLEAMASGLCPVVSRVAGNLEVVEHDKNGWTFPLDDDRELAAALTRLLEDRGHCARLAASARQYVVERHDLDKIARDYLELFRELARGKKGEE